VIRGGDIPKGFLLVNEMNIVYTHPSDPERPSGICATSNVIANSSKYWARTRLLERNTEVAWHTARIDQSLCPCGEILNSWPNASRRQSLIASKCSGPNNLKAMPHAAL
jgi:hypothetical protein